MLGRANRMCDTGVRAHGVLHQLRQANVRVPDLPTVRREGGAVLQSLNAGATLQFPLFLCLCFDSDNCY